MLLENFLLCANIANMVGFAAKIYYYEIKKSLPTSTEAPCHKNISLFQNFEVS